MSTKKPRPALAPRTPPPLARLRAVVAHEHAITRAGLEEILRDSGHVDVVAVAGTGAEVLRLLVRLRPDVAVLGLELPDMRGGHLVRAVREASVNAPMIMLANDDGAAVRAALAAGAAAFLLADASVHEILVAVHRVGNGKPYVSGRPAHASPRAARPAPDGPLERLTQAEQRVLSLLGHNLTSPDIAMRLGVSTRTIHNHRAHICTKLGLTGSNRLLQFALEHRLTVTEPTRRTPERA